MKVCTVCKQSKELNEFTSKGSGKFHSHCKSCQSVKSKKHYQKNKDAYKARAKKSNQKLKAKNKIIINEYKRSKGCLICDEKEPVALDFHHKDDKLKEANVSRMKNSSLSINTIMKEVNKCVVLCSNCHRKFHAGIIKIPE